MFIFSNGCSHTDWNIGEGYPTLVYRCLVDDNEPINLRTSFATQFLLKGKSDDGNDFSENPFHLDILDENRNLNLSFAYPGKSNDNIFHETIEALHYLKDVNKLPDFVFIQWSGPNRRLHQEPDGVFVDVGPHRLPEYKVKFEPLGSITTFHYMLLLQNFLKSNNIKYVFMSYMELDREIESLHTYKHLDLDTFITIENKHPLFDGFRNYFREKEWTLDWHGHPAAQAHYKLCELILEKLNKRDKLLPFDTLYNKNHSQLLSKGTFDFSEIKEKNLMDKLGDGETDILDKNGIKYKKWWEG